MLLNQVEGVIMFKGISMCLTPMSVRSKDGPFVTVPCGKCSECLTKRRQDWFIRLKEHLKDYEKASFVTFTYNDESLPCPLCPSLWPTDMQLYIKRLRKAYRNKRISYYMVGEYGTHTKRPHYHIIFFGIGIDDKDEITKHWPYGFVDVGSVTDASINYVCKYHVLRGKSPENTHPSFARMSKGIGKGYCDRYRSYHQEASHLRSFYYLNEFKKALPRYFKKNLYTYHQLNDIRVRTQERYDEKMRLECKNEEKVNYFKNLKTQIDKKNEYFKRKSEESGTL